MKDVSSCTRGAIALMTLAMALFAATPANAEVCGASGSITILPDAGGSCPGGLTPGDLVNYTIRFNNNSQTVSGTQVSAVLEGVTIVTEACGNNGAPCSAPLGDALLFNGCVSPTASGVICSVGSDNSVDLTLPAGGISVDAGGNALIATVQFIAQTPVGTDSCGLYFTRGDTGPSDLETADDLCDVQVTGGAQGSTNAFYPECAGNDQCSDANHCNGVEVCDPNGQCDAGPPLICDDNNVCTDNACEPAIGCVHPPIDVPKVCDDNNACTTEACDPQQGCFNPPIDIPNACDDGDACTAEACDPQTGCHNPPIDVPVVCDDGNACTENACDSDTGCQNPPIDVPKDCDDGNACTDEACDPDTGCHNPPLDVPVDCDDGDACTDEACDPNTGCHNPPIDVPTVCDDGDACTDNTCDSQTGCENPPIDVPKDCDDGDACTDEACDPDGGCFNPPIDVPTVCDDGDSCTADACDPTKGCVSTCDPSLDPDECFVAVGDFIWNDANANGIQDAEEGIDDVAIDVLACVDGVPGSSVGMTTTSAGGAYGLMVPACGDESLAIQVKSSNFAADGPLAGFNPSPQNAGDDDTVDSDCNPGNGLTACADIPRGTSDLTLDCGYFQGREAICRTPGFWGARGGYERGNQNITQTVIDAAPGGFINVCGQIIDSTVPVGDLDSALEAMCVSVEGVSLRQLYRHLTAAALNCVVSGAADCNALIADYDMCNTACGMGENADPDTVNYCGNVLDCFNNGGVLDSQGVCSTGTCAVDGLPCGDDAGDCAVIDVETDGHDDNVCVSYPNNCHDRSFCDSPNEDFCDLEPFRGASSSKACSEARKNSCTIDSCGGPDSSRVGTRIRAN